MSFNYTPPPAEVIRNGETASYALYAFLAFVPNVKLGALIGGIGSGIIAWKVASYAGGDLGGLSQLTNPPIHAVMGALIGAFISFVSKSVLKFFRRIPEPQSVDDEDEMTETKL